MADITINAVSTVTYLATGNPQNQLSGLGSQRVALLESPGQEMGRSGRSFVGGTSAVAGGQVPVVNLPTTTAGWVLYNSSPAGQGNRHLVIKRLTAFFASSSINLPATGFAVFGGVPPGALATALTANGSNHKTQSTRGANPAGPLAFIDVAKTIVAGTCWHMLGCVTAITNASTVGPSVTADLTGTPFIVPPTFCFAFGVMGDTTGTPLFGMSVAWDECEMLLP